MHVPAADIPAGDGGTAQWHPWGEPVLCALTPTQRRLRALPGIPRAFDARSSLRRGPAACCAARRCLQDFVETGVYTGGTSIIMAKVLERYAPSWGGSIASAGTAASGGRGSSDGSATAVRLWAADSFEGTPAPGAQDEGGSGHMRTG